MRLLFSLFLCLYLLTPIVSHAGNNTDSKTSEYKYIGNIESMKFHRPWCKYAQIMNPKRAKLFHYRKDAIEAKMQPCRFCLPPVQKKVKAEFADSAKP